MVFRSIHVLLAIFCCATEAFACKEYSQKIAYQESDFILIGTPQNPIEGRNSPPGPMTYPFEVKHIIKGDLPKFIQINETSAGCYGYRLFHKGAGIYLVYLVKVGEKYVGEFVFPNRKLPIGKAAIEKMLDSFTQLQSQETPK